MGLQFWWYPFHLLAQDCAILFFFHLPKTGGTTFSRFFAEQRHKAIAETRDTMAAYTPLTPGSQGWLNLFTTHGVGGNQLMHQHRAQQCQGPVPPGTFGMQAGPAKLVKCVASVRFQGSPMLERSRKADLGDGSHSIVDYESMKQSKLWWLG